MILQCKRKQNRIESIKNNKQNQYSAQWTK